MSDRPPPQPDFFDPVAGVEVTHGRLPHWSQAGAVAFITWRTADSLPAAVLSQLLTDRAAWLRAHGTDERSLDANATVARAFRRYCFDCWNGEIDRCLGTCPFRNPATARVVADSLKHFDGDRYVLFDFVVMPNHVHVLASFPDPAAMRAQCESWKQFTARELNRRLGRAGRFWQAECFDHLARTSDQFERLRDYIADNPRKAGLRPAEFAHYSIELPGSPARVAATEPHAERAGHTQGTSP